MWMVTKMLSKDWCAAVKAEAYRGLLAQMAVQDKLPAGVDPSDPKVIDALRQCYQRLGTPRRTGAVAA